VLTGGLLKPDAPFPPRAHIIERLTLIGIIDCRIIACVADGSTGVMFEPFASLEAA
jgi:hypothetical protein